MRRRLAAVMAAPLAGSVAAWCSSDATSPKAQSWPSFRVPERAKQRAGDGSVDAIMNYQQDDVEKIWTKRDASGSDDALYGAKWDQRQLIVNDGRLCATRLTLNDNGFELVPDPKEDHIDYYDEASVIGRYYGDCEALLQRVTGASIVRAFDHNVRSESGRAAGRKLRGGNAVQGPASLVHGDYTAASAPRRLKLLGQAPSLNDPLHAVLGETPLIDAPLVDAALSGRRRFAFVNIWRPIRTVHDKHLACVDAAGVRADDHVTFQIIYQDRVGENCACAPAGTLRPTAARHQSATQQQHLSESSPFFSPPPPLLPPPRGSRLGTCRSARADFAKWRDAHKWFYFSKMAPDEVLLIKQWDSAGELVSNGSKISTFALHSAFRDPTAPTGAPDRESIEVRLVLVFDE
jgi:hypothetical protein